MRHRVPLVLGAAAVAVFSLYVWVYLTAANADSSVYAWGGSPARLVGVMNREVYAWQTGPHADVACLECHEEVDPDQLRQAYATGEQIDLARWMKVNETQCEDCHQPQMESILKDLVPSVLTEGRSNASTGQAMLTRAKHQTHLDKGLSCTDCHTVHVEPGADPHTNCLDCHLQERVPLVATGSTSCTACHLDLAAVTPKDHQDSPAWLTAHGASAMRRPNCGECHLAPSAGPHSPLTRPDSFRTEQPDACLTCHAGVPMPHPQGYLNVHGQEFLEAAPGACATCHAPENGQARAESGPAQIGFCTDCHAGVPMPHPDGYLSAHGKAAQQGVASCQACHSSQNPVNPAAAHARSRFCTDCHAGAPMPHPDSFLSAHGQASRQGIATCEACHSPRNPVNSLAPHARSNFCSACHDAYQHPQGWVVSHGGKVEESCATCHSMAPSQGGHNACAACHTTSEGWHPQMWFITHSRQVEVAGEASCLKCHAEVEPSCAKCHAGR